MWGVHVLVATPRITGSTEDRQGAVYAAEGYRLYVVRCQITGEYGVSGGAPAGTPRSHFLKPPGHGFFAPYRFLVGGGGDFVQGAS